MFAFSTSLVSLKFFSSYLIKNTKHPPDVPEAFVSRNQILRSSDNSGWKESLGGL